MTLKTFYLELHIDTFCSSSVLTDDNYYPYQRAQYQDQLARKRYEDQLQQQVRFCSSMLDMDFVDLLRAHFHCHVVSYHFSSSAHIIVHFIYHLEPKLIFKANLMFNQSGQPVNQSKQYIYQSIYLSFYLPIFLSIHLTTDHSVN